MCRCVVLFFKFDFCSNHVHGHGPVHATSYGEVFRKNQPSCPKNAVSTTEMVFVFMYVPKRVY